MFPEYKYIYWCFHNTSLHFYGAEDNSDIKIPWQEVLFYWLPFALSKEIDNYVAKPAPVDTLINTYYEDAGSIYRVGY